MKIIKNFLIKKILKEKKKKKKKKKKKSIFINIIIIIIISKFDKLYIFSLLILISF